MGQIIVDERGRAITADNRFPVDVGVDSNPLPVQLSGSKAGSPYAGGQLCEDTFEDGLDGWTWLMHVYDPRPGPVWTSRRSMGRGAMLLATGAVPADSASGAGKATAIKRLMAPRREDGTYYPLVDFEAMLGWGGDTADALHWWGMGIDTQRGDVTDKRQYYKLKFVNYDEDTSTRVQQFRVQTPDGDVDVVGATIRHWNENKAGTAHVRLRVNIELQQYVAMWFNGKKFDLTGISGPNDGYVGSSSGYFDEGMNFSVDLLNRYGSPGAAAVHVDYVRGAYQ